MRVLHVSPTYWPCRADGGPPRSMYELGRALARAGSDVRVLTTDADGQGRVDQPPEREIVVEPGLRVTYARRVAGRSIAPSVLARLDRLTAWADVVHVSSVYDFTTVAALVSARRTERRVVWSARGGMQRWPGARKPFLKDQWMAACRRISPTALVHFTSSIELDESRSRIGTLRSVVIPNGIHVRDVHARPLGHRIVVGCLGRLHPIKQLPVAIQACELARQAGRDVELEIVGGGEPEHERVIRAAAAAARVPTRFLGHLTGSAKEDFLSRIDVLMAPSIRENFGLAVAEALAYGVYVIASTGTPWRELDARGCGRWLEPSASAFGQALLTMDAPSMVRARAEGPRWMRDEYSWDGVARQMRDAYRSVLEVTPT